MKQIFIKKENNPRLILFFAGWGSDENLFDRETKKGHDYMLCFDYQNLDFDYLKIKEYKEITVLAWSMGVWAANIVLSRPETQKLCIVKSIAINGTTTPIDDNKGIPTSIFKSTLDNFSEKTLAKFRRRICGNIENTKEFLSHSPYRDIDNLRDELSALWGMVASNDDKGNFRWDYAIIGLSDKIFPPEKQIAAWQEYEDTIIIKAEDEHYSPMLLNGLLLDTYELNIFTR